MINAQGKLIPLELVLAVFIRDSFTCKSCDIMPYNRPLSLVANKRVKSSKYAEEDLVTSCNRCIKARTAKEEIVGCEIIPGQYLTQVPLHQRQMMLQWLNGENNVARLMEESELMEVDPFNKAIDSSLNRSKLKL